MPKQDNIIRLSGTDGRVRVAHVMARVLTDVTNVCLLHKRRGIASRMNVPEISYTVVSGGRSNLVCSA
jgi:hypothetical protein